MRLYSFFLILLMSVSVQAQDSAPSSHLVFDDNLDGDILINEVRVPKSGEAMYTYYETLGWRGTAGGYAGIQAHPKAHLFLFSIWDHETHTAPIRAVYHGPGTETVGFGGEGTGLKSWNFELGWDTDTWYTLVARAWPVEDHTYFGFWARSDSTKRWTHLVTMDVAVAGARFQGGTDAFIEDWLDTGANPRTIHLRNGWKRAMDGDWVALKAARYSVNAWDLVEGKRSYHYRTHYNGGTMSDDSGPFYFMQSGGAETRPDVENPSRHAITRTDTEPDYTPLKLISGSAMNAGPGKAKVQWEVDPTTTPPFQYRVSLLAKKDSTQPLAFVEERIPHQRDVELQWDANVGTPEFARIECTDLFGRRADAILVPIQ